MTPFSQSSPINRANQALIRELASVDLVRDGAAPTDVPNSTAETDKVPHNHRRHLEKGTLIPFASTPPGLQGRSASADHSKVDISPREAPVGRQLLWLGIAATVFIGAVVAAGAVIVLSGELAFDSIHVTPFRGWQVYVTMAALAVLVALVAVIAVRLVVRTFRRLGDRTRHGRAVITAAVLPGIWIGGFLLSPMTAAVSWAADRTSDAAAAQRQLDGMFLDSPVRPPLFPSDHPPADAATASQLLHATDLGAGWWDADTPNPVALKPPAIAPRATGAARTILAEQYRVSGEWHIDRMIMESETRFRAADDARRYVLDAQHRSPPTDTSPVIRTNRTLGAFQVWETTSKSGRTARFVVGTTAFSLTTDVHSTDQASADRILTRAITRATKGR